MSSAAKDLRTRTAAPDLRTGRSTAPEGTFGALGISVNLAGSVPSWNGDASLPLAAGRAAEAASQAVVESVLTGSEAASGAEPTGVPDAGRTATQGQVAAQATEPGLPVLSAQPIAVRPLRGIGSSGMPEDWFESSLPAKDASGAGVMEPTGPAQSIHANLQASSRLDATRLVEGLYTGMVDSGKQLRSNQVDFETVPIQFLAAEATAGAVLAQAAAERNRLEWPRTQLDDPLMKQIPLLFAPIPVEPQQGPMRVRFKAVVVNGILTSGAVLATLLLATLDLKDLSGIETMELAAGGLALVGALLLILRCVRPRRA